MLLFFAWWVMILVDDPEMLGGRQKKVQGNADQEELAVPQDYEGGTDLVHTR